jgi:hypothetical protein
MSAPAAIRRAWSLAGRIATTADGSRLDLDAPGRGLVMPGGSTVLGVDLRADCTAADHWLRGDDLIAVYEPADPRRLRATAMWRPLDATGASVGWELTLSAQTASWHSDPTLAVTADVACADLLWSRGEAESGWAATAGGAAAEATCVLLRRQQSATLVAVHPADARRLVVRHAAGRAAIACWLFSTAIEKGVLLRGRVLAAVGPAEGAEAWAVGLLAAFAASPPPLTA